MKHAIIDQDIKVFQSSDKKCKENTYHTTKEIEKPQTSEDVEYQVKSGVDALFEEYLKLTKKLDLEI